MNRRAVFLDVDGVLLDPERTSAEWVRLMGDVLAPALGGRPEDWGRANALIFPRVFRDRASWRDDDPLVAQRQLVTMVLREQCELLGLPPVSEDVADRLGREMDLYVCRHARATYPAAIPVIHELAAAEYDLHTATGNPSWKVEALFEQWGVRDLFGVPAGADLAGAMKDSDEFYPAVFELAGVGAGDAVVIDDAPEHLQRARALGARTVWVNAAHEHAPAEVPEADAVIGNVAELPAALTRLG